MEKENHNKTEVSGGSFVPFCAFVLMLRKGGHYNVGGAKHPQNRSLFILPFST